MNDISVVATQLAALLERIAGVRVPLDDPAARAASLWSLGISSADLIKFLAGIEDEFGLSWDLDDSEEATASFDLLTEHVAAKATRAPSGPADPA